MKILIRLLLLLISIYTHVTAAEIQLTDRSVLRFATSEQGSEFLASRDEYIVLMSPFDRAARLHSAVPVSEEDMLVHLSNQSLQWSDSEIRKFSEFVTDIRPALNNYNLNFPGTVLLLKTTTEDEGGAEVAYTRRNGIIFTSRMLQNTDEMLRTILVHEFFHILSRQNPDLQVRLYNMIGFQRCNPIQLPDDLAGRKLTNPDAPRNDNYIRVTHNAEDVAVVPLIYARQQLYTPGKGNTIFDFLEFKLLRVQQRGGIWEPFFLNDDVVLYGVRDVDGFFDKIGNNTQYIIHPEEILADNFMYMITDKKDLPTPRIIEEMKRILNGTPK